MKSLYGFCPLCGAKGITRERRPNGNDKCKNGHVYPSKNATMQPKRKTTVKRTGRNSAEISFSEEDGGEGKELAMETLTLTQEVVTNTTVNYEIKGNIVAVKTTTKIGKRKPTIRSFFTTVDELRRNCRGKNFTVSTFMSDLKVYLWYSDEELKILTGNYSYEDPRAEKVIEDSDGRSALEIMHSDWFHPRNVVFFDYKTHLYYPSNSDFPLSPRYHFSHLDGITNEHFDLPKAAKILKKKKYVSDIDIVTIPSYNQSEGCTHELRFYAQLPQTVFNKLVRFYRDQLKSQFWSCRVHQCIIPTNNYDDAPDALGLKKALKTIEVTVGA